MVARRSGESPSLPMSHVTSPLATRWHTPFGEHGMNIFDSVFDGLLGYEKLMLVCGLVLFVFALVAITVMIVQRRDFKMVIVLIVFAIVLMGFPGVQAIKFSQDMVELDRIRTQPAGTTNPAQQQESTKTLQAIEARAAGDPQLQAKVADGYRAIGEVDKAYQLAQSVLQQEPPPQVQATLVPVLTAKLNQVQANVPIVASAPVSAASSPLAEAAPTHAPSTSTASSAATGMQALGAQQREIADVAGQLQAIDAPLPATAHAALAKAYVVLDHPQQAQANIDAALRLNPGIRINPRVLQAARARNAPRTPEH